MNVTTTIGPVAPNVFPPLGRKLQEGPQLICIPTYSFGSTNGDAQSQWPWRDRLELLLGQMSLTCKVYSMWVCVDVRGHVWICVDVRGYAWTCVEAIREGLV